MFNKVISHKGFWRSVVLLGMAYMAVLMCIQWVLTGFSKLFFTARSPWIIVLVFVMGSFVCGFSVTYARIWSRLKREAYKK